MTRDGTFVWVGELLILRLVKEISNRSPGVELKNTDPILVYFKGPRGLFGHRMDASESRYNVRACTCPAAATAGSVTSLAGLPPQASRRCDSVARSKWSGWSCGGRLPSALGVRFVHARLQRCVSHVVAFEAPFGVARHQLAWGLRGLGAPVPKTSSL